VLEARYRLTPGDPDLIRAKMNELNACRREKQPLTLPSAGSVFKRPEGHFAGALIEKAGLKGHTIGGAQVSTLHAGFIVNVGGATAKDVTALIAQIQREVLAKFGVPLECEVRVLGEE
jgi:UDP-N-acetylmuramate dehydrogenase